MKDVCRFYEETLNVFSVKVVLGLWLAETVLDELSQLAPPIT